MENMHKQELISALADGQLDGEQFASAVEAACADPAAREAWYAYHLIGDVLRAGERASCRTSVSVAARVSAQIAREPGIPREAATGQAATVQAALAKPPVQAAANDGAFRWKMVAGFATAASVAVVGWNLTATRGAQAPGAVLASSQPSASAVQPTMLRDPRLDELLAAHRQYAGATALHTPAVFLRNATFETPSR